MERFVRRSQTIVFLLQQNRYLLEMLGVGDVFDAQHSYV